MNTSPGALSQMATAEVKIAHPPSADAKQKLVGKNLEIFPNTIRFSGPQNGAILSRTKGSPVLHSLTSQPEKA